MDIKKCKMKHSPAVGHPEVTLNYSLESQFSFLIEVKVL